MPLYSQRCSLRRHTEGLFCRHCVLLFQSEKRESSFSGPQTLFHSAPLHWSLKNVIQWVCNSSLDEILMVGIMPRAAPRVFWDMVIFVCGASCDRSGLAFPAPCSTLCKFNCFMFNNSTNLHINLTFSNRVCVVEMIRGGSKPIKPVALQ